MRYARVLILYSLPLLLYAQAGDFIHDANAAQQALLEGRYTEAIAAYQRLILQMPNEPGLRLNLAIAFEKSGQPSDAIPQLERVTRAQPKLAGAWFLLGLAYAQLKRPASAIAPLRRAVELDPANSDALLELADAELGADQPAQAAIDFQTLASRHPEMAKAWEGLGLAWLRQSEDAFAEIEKQAPHSAYDLALRARNRAARGELEEALRLYEQALELDPKLPQIHEARAAIYREMGRTELAGRGASLSSSSPPDWTAMIARAQPASTPHSLYLTGIAAAELAEQSFAHLASLPASPESHELLAESYERSGRRLDAIAEWRKALALDPENARVCGHLAEALYRAREYAEAESLLEPLVAKHPENADWQYLLGSDLFKQKRDNEALPHLLKAAELEPDFLPVWENLGLAYLDLDQPEKAIPCLEKARPLDQGSISFALSNAYRRVGRTDEAKAALARYRELQGGRTAGDTPR